MTATDDTEEQSVAGSEIAPSLEALYTAHAAALTRVLHAAGLPDASDAVQEAFVQAVVHWRKVSTYDDPLAWIRRVAINRGLNRRRAWRRRAALTERLATTTPAFAVDPTDADGDLAGLILTLPPQQRLALSLFYFADLSVADVADAMQLSEGTVKYHLHAARAALARALEHRDDD